jgi:hypothetical protein
MGRSDAMKIIIVRPPLQQSSIALLKPWAGNEELVYTNSDLLVKLRPNTRKVDEPNQEQLEKANAIHELMFVYPNIDNLKRDAGNLNKLPGQKRVIVDGRAVNVEDYVPREIDPTKCLRTPNGAQLRYYQQQLVDFTMERKRVGLFVDMGLGKTLATLATVDELFKKGSLSPDKPILVIAPKMVALDTWSREAEKWGYDIDVLINIGLTKKKREALFEKARNVTKPTLLTTNPEQLEHIKTAFSDRINPFQMIIVDELSLFKSATSKRFEYLQELSERLEYFVGLTGTPAPNSLLDVWSQLVIINPNIKYELGRTFFQYRNHFFAPDVVNPRTGVVFSWKLNPGAEEAIYQKIEPHVISMRGAGLVDIPDVTYTNEYVYMDKKSKKVYDYFDKEIRKELSGLDQGEQLNVQTGANEVTIANSAILKSKLLQLATGAMYDADSTVSERKYTVFHDAKIEKLKELINVANSPVLVFYNFVSDLERIRKAIPGIAVLDTKDKNANALIKKWNEGRIPVLLANPASTGHGLNLQDGGHIIVWFSQTWRNEVYRQANKRLHRSGQKHPVQIIHIVTKDTADEEVVPRIDEKEEQQQGLLSALQIDNS